MKSRPSFESVKKKVLKKKAIRAEYEALRPEFEILEQLIKARKQAHISQAELTKRLKKKTPSIGYLEKGGYATTSITNVSKVAIALGYSLKFSLEPKKRI